MKSSLTTLLTRGLRPTRHSHSKQRRITVNRSSTITTTSNIHTKGTHRNTTTFNGPHNSTLRQRHTRRQGHRRIHTHRRRQRIPHGRHILLHLRHQRRTRRSHHHRRSQRRRTLPTQVKNIYTHKVQGSTQRTRTLNHTPYHRNGSVQHVTSNHSTRHIVRTIRARAFTRRHTMSQRHPRRQRQRQRHHTRKGGDVRYHVRRHSGT